MNYPSPIVELLLALSLPPLAGILYIKTFNISPILFEMARKITKKAYNKQCYIFWHDNAFKSSTRLIPLLLLRTKTFWVIIFSMIPAFTMSKFNETTPFTSLYISLNAAGIFYIIFNLIPELKNKCQAARQANNFISSIKVTRATIMSELTGKFIFTEANRVITKEMFLGIGDDLRAKYHAPSILPIVTTNSIHVMQIPISTQLHINYKGAKNMFDVMRIVVDLYLELIKKAKGVAYIDKLELYDALCFLESEINECKKLMESTIFPITETQLIAYILSAPDKLNYYAQKELPKYVGGRFDLKIKLSKDEINSAKKLNLTHYFRH